MISSILKSVRWSLLVLGVKFSRVVPIFTLINIALTLISQVLMLLAFLLPLKVILLLGSDRIPAYFPSSLAALGRDNLIIMLGVATIGFFILHMAVERVVRLATHSGTKRLLLRSHKMVLFENQDEIAANAYQRYSSALAGGVFVLTVLSGFAVYYPEMAVVIIGYAIVAFTTTCCLSEISHQFEEKLTTSPAPVLKVASGLGFFVVFGYLVADFVFWQPPHRIIAFASILLSRQLLTRCQSIVGDLFALQSQRVKIDALFFHSKVLPPVLTKTDKSFWPLLDKTERKNWITAVINELEGAQCSELQVSWFPILTQGVVGLQVKADRVDYLLKLYENNRSFWACHEATLMSEDIEHLPALKFVGTTQVQNFHCMVYILPSGVNPIVGQELNKIQIVLRQHLLPVELSDTFVRRYKRSKSLLWQRLHIAMFERMYVVTDNDQQVEIIKALLAKLPSLQQQLQQLPLVVVNPDLKREDVWVIDENAQPCFLSWERWSLEPLGAGWPVISDLLQKLAPALLVDEEHRSVLENVLPERAELAALAFALEQEYNKKRFMQALELLPEILNRLDACERKENAM